MKLLILAAIATLALPAQAYSNKARMCDALLSEAESVARSYQQAVRVGNPQAPRVKAKLQRMIDAIPAECR